jgi:hypothetical protein
VINMTRLLEAAKRDNRLAAADLLPQVCNEPHQLGAAKLRLVEHHCFRL